MPNSLKICIYANKRYAGFQFENVRSERTVIVERVVVVGRTTFARKKDGKLLAFDLNRSIHYRIGDRGALHYVEAAWRLGAVKKSIYDVLAKAAKDREAKNDSEQAAANALDYADQAGAKFAPGEAARLKKIAGRK